MTKDQIKEIVATGDFCIEKPIKPSMNNKWRMFVDTIDRGFFGDRSYYSPTKFTNGCNFSSHPESKTVLTLDQWWDAVHSVEDQPAQWQPQPGEMVEVKNNEYGEWNERKFIALIKGFYVCENVCEDDAPIAWKYCQQIQPIAITPDQAIHAYAELNKVDAGRVKILD